MSTTSYPIQTPHPLIPRSVYERVIFVRGVDYGTAFLIEIDRRQYLVTAAHLVDVESSSIDIKLTTRLEAIGIRGTRVCRGDVDIAVLALDRWLPVAEPVPLAPPAATVVTQDVYFIGFPYQMWGNAPKAMGERPLPLVAKGMLSSGFSEGSLEAFVSGFNSPGFSGAPLLFQHLGLQQMMIAGIVSKFKLGYETVRRKVDGQDTGFEVAYNSGFLVVYGIEHAIALARAMAMGPTDSA